MTKLEKLKAAHKAAVDVYIAAANAAEAAAAYAAACDAAYDAAVAAWYAYQDELKKQEGTSDD